MEIDFKKIFSNRFFLIVKLSIFPALFLNAILLFFSFQDAISVKQKLIEKERDIISLQSIKIILDIKQTILDVYFFAHYHEIKNIFTDSCRRKNAFSKDLMLFNRGSRMYDQIRFIKTNGDEFIRINMLKNLDSIMVPDHKLQNKRDRYYFQEAIKLKENSIYLSPLDLNVEHGKLEQPLKPMIRIASASFNKSGKKMGVLIFNYLAQRLIDNFQESIDWSPASHFLINKDGYFLISNLPDMTWGFMHKDRKDKNMKFLYPDIWALMNKIDHETVQKDNEHGVFTIKSVYPLKQMKIASSSERDIFNHINLPQKNGYKWYVVSFLSREIISAHYNNIFIRYFYVALIINALIFIAAWLLTGNRTLRTALSQKINLVREIQHRVRNNLQVVQSLISLHGFSNSNETDDINCRKCSNRIQVLSLAQVNLSKSTDFIQVSIKNFISDLIKEVYDTFHVNPNNIPYSIQCETKYLPIDKATSCGMIINELVSNSLMHAFPRGKGEIHVRLNKKDNRTYQLIVQDNGTGFEQDIQFENIHHVGLNIVQMMAYQLSGKLQIENKKGSKISVTFKEK